MLKTTKKQALRNLFIFSTSIEERVNQKIQHLTLEARQAYYERNYEKLTVAGQELVQLKTGEPYGLYFLALAQSQQGKRKSSAAREIFQRLADNPNDAVRAASLLALGVMAYRVRDYREARILIKNASEIADRCGDAKITSTMCKTANAAIHSDLGDYRASVSLMHETLPQILLLFRYVPAYSAMELNNYAYDLNQANQPEYASQIITKVLRLPCSESYPEWQQTKASIDAKLNQAKKRQDSTAKLSPNNVVDINLYRKAKQKSVDSSLDIYTKKRESSCQFGRILLDGGGTLSALKMKIYFKGLNTFTTTDSLISVMSYLCGNGRRDLIDERSIVRGDLSKLDDLIRESNAVADDSQYAEYSK